MFVFFCQLIFRVQNKNEAICFIQHSHKHYSFNFHVPHASKCYIRPVSYYVRAGARPNKLIWSNFISLLIRFWYKTSTACNFKFSSCIATVKDKKVIRFLNSRDLWLSTGILIYVHYNYKILCLIRVRRDLVVTKDPKERRDHKDKKEFRERVIQR